MTEWDKITDEQMRVFLLEDLRRMLAACKRLAERSESEAARPGLPLFRRKNETQCTVYARRQAVHCQQAIDLLTAAPMPDTVRPTIDRAAAILRARGIDATAGLDSVAVASDGHPTYLVRGVGREDWTAERIAADIERLEQAKLPEVKP